MTRSAIACALLALSIAPTSAATVSLRQADVKIPGDTRDDVAGYSVAGLGDVNGDRRPDVAVAAGVRRGDIYVLFGPLRRSTASLRTRLRRRHGFRITYTRSLAVEPAGDVNGDGRDDLIVRTLRRDNENAEPPIYVVFGRRATSTVDLRRLGAGGFRIDGRGVGTAGGGDVNGDGRADLAVTVPMLPGATDPGSVYVIFGKTDAAPVNLGAIGAQGYRIDGDPVGPAAFVNDVNGDGRSELAFIGASNSAYVVYGKPDTATISIAALAGRGYQIAGRAGQVLYDMAGAGDVNRDGRGDLLLVDTESQAGDLNNESTVFVVFGVPGVPVDLATPAWPGYTAATAYVTSVANAGDTNRDGRPDALIGEGIAEPDSRNNAYRGRATLLFGRDGRASGPVGALQFESTAPRCECNERGANAGWDVAGAGDQSGDRRADLLLGAPRVSDFSDPRFRRPGTAYVVYSPRIVVGSDRSEVIRGSSGNDLIFGLGGNDTISGGPGSDTLEGGAGRDRLVGGAGSDRLEGGPGDDTLLGGLAGDDLFGGLDPLEKSASGRDRLVGGAGDDFLAGNDRADVIDTGPGDDIAYGGSGADRMSGGAGRDLLLGDGVADYSLRKFVADGTGWDHIDGGAGNDIFWAGGGADILYGRRGSDIFHPGADRNRDLVDGGPGRDSYQRQGGRARDLLLSIEFLF